MDGFEVFTRYKSRSVKDMQVTIQRDGTAISFNRVAYQALGNPEGVQLLYNAEKRLIGVVPVDLRKVPGTKINRQGSSDSYYIAGKAFVHEYEIDTSVARRYQATLENNMLVVDLNGPSADATGPRLHNEPNKPLSDTTQQLSFDIRGNESEATIKAQEAQPQNEATALNELDIALVNAIERGVSLDKIAKRMLDLQKRRQL